MSVFEDAAAPWAQRFGRASLKLRHGLAPRALFTDAALEALLDCVPDERVEVFAAAHRASGPNEWRAVSAAGLTGAQRLQAIRQGRLWLELPAVNRHHDGCAGLCEEIFAALESHAMVLGSFARDARLVIGSPHVRRPCQVDPAMETLWQLRGTQTLHVYPAHAPFLAAERLERIVRRLETGRLVHDPHWDARAEVFEMRPGDMLSWRQHAPSRAIHGPALTVALTVTHLTREARRQSDLIYANALLRRAAGLTPSAGPDNGPVALAKVTMAQTARRASRKRRPVPAARATVRLDPARPGELLPL